MVRAVRLELTLPKERVFETRASTGSATPANVYNQPWTYFRIVPRPETHQSFESIASTNSATGATRDSQARMIERFWIK